MCNIKIRIMIMFILCGIALFLRSTNSYADPVTTNDCDVEIIVKPLTTAQWS